MSTLRASDDSNSTTDANYISSDRGEVDTTPFLNDEMHSRRSRFGRRTASLRGAARFLRRASNRRMMREPSVRVREAAAEQIEERQTDWAYSKPVVILDILWNLAFVMASISVLIMSRHEKPSTPLKLWIIGYALQCVVHMVCVCVEYKRRSYTHNSTENENFSPRRSSGHSSSSDLSDSADYHLENHSDEGDMSVTKHLQSANTMFSFVWWIVGFYWVSADSQILSQDSPQLYWLCITFLAFDVFFVLLCIAVACIIGIAVCCCLPCIIAILYAVADQEGATKEDIERLTKYKFRSIGAFEKQNDEIVQVSYSGIMTECDTDTPTQHVLAQEDAECCICLCAYDDGVELRELPCRHHFHCACIDKWLYTNATCPLCKFNILKNGNSSGSDQV